MIEKDNLHKLLKRQIKKHLKDVDELPSNIQNLLNAVNQAYFEFDDDIRRSEIILDKSLKELFAANSELKAIAETKTAEAESVGKRLTTIVETVSEIIFQSNEQKELSYLNPAWNKITGYSVEESLHTSFLDYTLEEDIPKILSLRAKIHETEDQHQDVVRIKDKNRDIKWLQITARATKNDRGKIIGISGIMADVTETHLTQQENNRLALFAQKTQNMVITTNTNGEIEWVNKAFTQITGYPLDYIIGKRPGSFLQGPETSQQTIKEISQHIQEKKPYVGEIFNYNKKGEGYWLELSIDPIIDEGKHLGYIAVETVINERKQQQQKLEYQQYLLQEAQSLAKIGSWEYTIKDDHFSWSDEMYKILEIKEGTPISRSSYISKIHPQDVDKFKSAIENAFKTGTENHVEHRLVSKNGEIRYIRGIGKPILNGNGHYISMRGLIQDITDEKTFEKKLIKYQNDLDEAQLLTKMGSFEYSTSNKVIEWSKNAHAVFELPSLVNLKTLDFEKYIHPDDYSIFQESWDKSIREKTSFQIEYRFIPRENTLIYIEGSAQPSFNSKGELTKIVGTVQNITERKLAELEIKRNEEKYRNLLEAMDLGILEVSKNGIITNAFDKFCEMTGYTKDELIGGDPNEILLSEDQIPKIEQESENRQKGLNGLYELEINRKDGSKFWVLISGTPIYDKHRNYIGSLGIHMDIDERKKSEQKLKEYTRDLEKINSELDQFAYIVSHDLKAPLRAINNLSLWIEEDIADNIDGETKEYFELMRGRVGRMENLINGILEYSRAGRLKTSDENVDLNTLLYTLSDSLKIKDNIEFIIQENLPVFRTEKVALEQVFSNFISNGIKYNDKDEITIEMGCEELENEYEFFVKDNGPGIDKAYHKKIFQIFQTLQARDEVESTGVGLAIVKKIIDEKEGNIRIDSELGKGTTIYFTWKK